MLKLEECSIIELCTVRNTLCSMNGRYDGLELSNTSGIEITRYKQISKTIRDIENEIVKRIVDYGAK